MSVSTAAYKGAEQPVKGIALICLAVLLFASHDTLSKYLSGFYPIVMVVWARYVVHTLLMLVVFVPRSGFSAVVRTKRPGLQLLRALCLIGTSLFFTTGLRYIPWPRPPRSTSSRLCWSPPCPCRCWASG